MLYYFFSPGSDDTKSASSEEVEIGLDTMLELNDEASRIELDCETDGEDYDEGSIKPSKNNRVRTNM